mmetsp:Transcript_42563/g.89341  ORF Transcript_42563/g.89341 Transcript_42563/m.89341 type:complete len:103 (-) Transcript_42563:685-993(-)
MPIDLSDYPGCVKDAFRLGMVSPVMNLVTLVDKVAKLVPETAVWCNLTDGLFPEVQIILSWIFIWKTIGRPLIIKPPESEVTLVNVFPTHTDDIGKKEDLLV